MQTSHLIVSLLTTSVSLVLTLDPCLYPHASETRDVQSLDGLWNFCRSRPGHPDEGIRAKWYERDLARSQPIIAMPVPASYNDITVDRELRDHVGVVWYDRRFFAPGAWASDGRRVWLRFGSVHYAARVWVNGKLVAQHQSGHLPFQADITDAVICGAENRVTVLCDNVLLEDTVPQGSVEAVQTENGTVLIPSYTFDFLNYAGIHRSVHLYTTPPVHIKSVYMSSSLNGTIGRIHYRIEASNGGQNISAPNLIVAVQIFDRLGDMVANASSDASLSGHIDVPDAKLWWPYLMSPEPGYLYTVRFELTDGAGVRDVYRMRQGIRTLRWTSTQLLINERPVYLRGFGRHEDSDIRGKGLDMALLTRDFNLLHWVGANAYRTSHYPYSEESMQFADEAGIMVIDECPSVDTDLFSAALLHRHKRTLHELIVRDRNHASVIMWSIANEPRTQHAKSDAYFGAVAKYTRSLDPHRPITAAINQPSTKDYAAQHLDIVGFNRYNGWYANAGRLDLITAQVISEAMAWHQKHQKPVMMLEYGADTVAGMHTLPSVVWTEDYQGELFEQHFRAFDQLRTQNFFVGEFIWNFADFMTSQVTHRVVGNKKGIFTRQRQPKTAAWLVRQRYHAIAKADAHSDVPVSNIQAKYVFEREPQKMFSVERDVD